MINMENKIFEGIFYTRFIASWNSQTIGKYSNRRIERKAFRAWLKTITVNGKHLPEEVVREIANLKDNGKLELEIMAKSFEYSE